MQRHPALLRLAVAVLVLVGVYGALATFLSGHVPSRATVDGIPVGGMSAHEATITLKRILATPSSRPVHLAVPSRTVDIQPGPAGLEMDLAGTLSDLTRFTVNPAQLWAHLTTTVNQPLIFRVDRGRLMAAVTTAARALDRPVQEGSITFTGGKAKAVVSMAGNHVEVPATTDAVASAWPHRQVVQAVTKMTQPKVSPGEIQRAARELAIPAMSGPVKVAVGSHAAATIILQPRQYAPALSVTPDRTGLLRLNIDAPKLLAAIRGAAPGIERTPVDATVRMVAGTARVVPAVLGMRINETSVPSPFLAALSSSTRTATIKVVPIPPKVTTAVAQGWQVRGAMSTFTTHFPVNPPRTNNIRIAVATLNDTLVPAGGRFSLNATLGERTPARGYRQAPVIYAGRLVTDYGGGVSQVSTTTFNAAFFAGVRIDQHTPHSFYISRYPEGREATVSWPSIDQVWTNDTGAGILIKAEVSGNDITVTFLGSRKWDIEAVKGPRRNVVQPKTIVDPRADCVPQLPTPGFDVSVTQIFRKNRARVKTVRFDTHYIPEDNVVCTHSPAR